MNFQVLLLLIIYTLIFCMFLIVFCLFLRLFYENNKETLKKHKQNLCDKIFPENREINSPTNRLSYTDNSYNTNLNNTD